jgi:deazaflavin-dependent oxidoreductase (nitroreductase family)
VLPGFGIVAHVGRKSGRDYRTPVNVFPVRDSGFVILLLYSAQSDWLRNVLAAGEGRLGYRRRQYLVSEPRIVTGNAGRALLPWPSRIVIALVWCLIIDFSLAGERLVRGRPWRGFARR